ncbi:5-(carboxyamino)imidazole ribonucleotide synthase [Pseudobacteriovorax antillogorgiicola]|uniref:N5-carboxyaminoimidazole ribonucleotide synthase n=1 Tax=Pseudobacteriovorax antillogorgiicola TaxID=1513793 RepID=A0A1Y6CKC3_9BACT|nr:5-(carboxyamino)imidazole ribonucleotide synthase [Pseudobacteriovorax antillogorgiicola]TCS47697.1 5-(carboxyamino)imidazole ribonucleotide synthase [Pseudobacteriovorax antillogorgiicola]SMF59449.1 5-(carboxyamino)imidazole ribonucleotide synthase [Pseudobacteriovorax antillogorgiicola]
MTQNPRLGILGSGQLALLLTQSARSLGYPVHIYAKHEDDPACADADRVLIGPLDDRQRLTVFLKDVDVVMFESEFIDTALLASIAEGEPTVFAPDLRAMDVGADKWQQKQLFNSLSIATSAAIPSDSYEAVASFVDAAVAEFSGGFVLKWAREGYDGIGVHVVPHPEDCHGAAHKAALIFCEKAIGKGSVVYAEAFVPYERELAMVACRDGAGNMTFYPLVETQQKQGVCHTVKVPASEWGVSREISEAAEASCRKVAEHLGLVGSFALEFFFTKSQDLLVNEFAPRVHNSGHYTSDAAVCSQFENHVRACVGQSLGSSKVEGYWGMINVLGGPAYRGPAQEPKIQVAAATSYWYGKKQLRPMRKMGHINVSGVNKGELEKRLVDIDKSLEQWQQHFKDK